MSLASLPMYDLPELRGAHAALWAGIARQLRQAGIADVPAALCQERPASEVWAIRSCCSASAAAPI